MSVSTVEVLPAAASPEQSSGHDPTPRVGTSQQKYFERKSVWADSGANWSVMEEAFVHRINVAMGVAAFAALAGAPSCSVCRATGSMVGIVSAMVRCDSCDGFGVALPEIVFTIPMEYR